jgi:hypothetical protein
VACIEVILKNAPSTSTEFVNFFAKFQRQNPAKPRGMRFDLSIPILGLLVIDLVRPSRLPLHQVRIFFLTLKKANEYNEKSKEKSPILHEFTDLS